MVEVEKSITIRRPIGEVFAYVSDIRHSVDWQTGLLEGRKMTEGPLSVGTQFAAVRKFMGRKLETSIEFVEYEPDMLFTFRNISGPIPFETSYLFESAPEGTTTVTIRMEMQPGGFFGNLAEPLIAANLRRDMDTNLGNLKDMLEAQAVEISS